MTHFQNLFPNLPERIGGLGELAENLWWSWNPEARMHWAALNFSFPTSSMYIFTIHQPEDYSMRSSGISVLDASELKSRLSWQIIC